MHVLRCTPSRNSCRHLCFAYEILLCPCSDPARDKCIQKVSLVLPARAVLFKGKTQTLTRSSIRGRLQDVLSLDCVFSVLVDLAKLPSSLPVTFYPFGLTEKLLFFFIPWLLTLECRGFLIHELT